MHSAVQVQQEFRRRFGRALPTPVTIRTNFEEVSPKELAKIFVNKIRQAKNSAVRFLKSQNRKGSLTWCKLHTHHDVFQTDK